MLDFRVSDVMNPAVITILDEATLLEAVERMNAERISALVVVDHAQHMVGLLSQTDIVRAWSEAADSTAITQRPVSEYMSRDVISCAPHKPLAYAMKMLDEHKIRRLIVVETRDGGRFVTDRMRPVGVLSQTDIVRALTRRSDTVDVYGSSESASVTMKH